MDLGLTSKEKISRESMHCPVPSLTITQLMTQHSVVQSTHYHQHLKGKAKESVGRWVEKYGNKIRSTCIFPLGGQAALLPVPRGRCRDSELPTPCTPYSWFQPLVQYKGGRGGGLTCLLPVPFTPMSHS